MSRRSKYDWGSWFGRPRTVLHRGIDYHISQSMMYQTIKNNACRRGVSVKLRDCGDYIVLEVAERYGQVSHSKPEAALNPQ